MSDLYHLRYGYMQKPRLPKAPVGSDRDRGIMDGGGYDPYALRQIPPRHVPAVAPPSGGGMYSAAEARERNSPGMPSALAGCLSTRRSVYDRTSPGQRVALAPGPGVRQDSPYFYTDLHPNAVWPAAAVAGRRMTQMGTYGDERNPERYWEDARERVQRQESGGRAPSYTSSDAPRIPFRRSGTLGRPVGESIPSAWSQNVPCDYPFLHLKAGGEITASGGEGTFVGNCRIRVTAGMFETGGATAVRTFWLGGGLTGQFNLAGWDQCTVEVLDMEEGTNVSFAWVTTGMQASNQTLYMPTTLAQSGAGTPVPEGAYALVMQDTGPGTLTSEAAITWYTLDPVGAAPAGGISMTINIGNGTSSFATANQFGTPLPVLGTNIAFTGITPPDATVIADIVWLLRPI